MVIFHGYFTKGYRWISNFAQLDPKIAQGLASFTGIPPKKTDLSWNLKYIEFSLILHL